MERRLFFYRFCFSGGVLGGESTSLLPFLFFWRSFGWREDFSATVFVFLEEFRVERALLCYRFCFSGGVLGGESTSLLPFLLFWRSFGRRGDFSFTVFVFLEDFWAERALLCYLFSFSGGISGWAEIPTTSL
ncbi:hypothetical protein AAV98_19070 [Bacillus sp. CHD6a]|nr:hypothetical protein AAV98_19070 [Bacillus sp. CHD6a]